MILNLIIYFTDINTLLIKFNIMNLLKRDYTNNSIIKSPKIKNSNEFYKETFEVLGWLCIIYF